MLKFGYGREYGTIVGIHRDHASNPKFALNMLHGKPVAHDYVDWLGVPPPTRS